MKRSFKIALLLFVLALPVFLQQKPSLRDLVAKAELEKTPLPDSSGTKAIVVGSSRMSPRLASLAGEANTKGIGVSAEDGVQRGLIVQNQMVAVRFVAAGPEEALRLRRKVEELGGSISGSVGDVLLGSIPVARVSAIADSPDLEYLGVQSEWQQLARTTEGVRIVNVPRLHASGLTGRGVKVGILDFGFEGYGRLQQAGVVPQPKAIFEGGGHLENGVVHGAGCAEIIHAMAPDAELYLAVAGPKDEQFLRAAQWLTEQGVDIINYSAGTAFEPTDGRGFGALVVDEISNKRNILWSVSSGNDGDSHWSGPAVDKDGDGYVDIGAPGKQLIGVQAHEDKLSVVVRWDDWGANPMHPTSSQDINAYLYEISEGGNKKLVDKSEEKQDGNGEPLELVRVAKTKPGTIYGVALRMAHVTRPVTIHVFADNTEMYPVTAVGSVLSPASARTALAVGAVRAADGKLVEYSSQGPTDDGRVKPDVAAPTEVASESYPGAHGFAGTSASAPHVSGFAALLKQQSPQLRGQELFHRVVASVKAVGTPVPNNLFGFGMIDANTVVLRAEAPRPGGGTTPPPPAPPAPVPPTPVSGGKVELPAAWGGAVPAAALDSLIGTPRPSSDGLKASVVVGRDRYRVGDGMKIGYRVNRDSHYLLLHRDSRGAYTLVAPHIFTPAMMAGNESYLLPGAGMAVSVVEPAGREQFLLLAAPKPLDLHSGAGAASLAVGVARYEVTLR